MSSKRRPPCVPAEVREGRLVRVCPVCGQHIVEHTDDEGMISNSFAEHYEAEHPATPESEKLRLYVLGAQPAKDGFGIRDTSGINRSALDHVRRQPFEQDVEWQLVDRLEDLTILCLNSLFYCYSRKGHDDGKALAEHPGRSHRRRGR